MSPFSYHHHRQLLQTVADTAIRCYKLPAQATARLINLSENATYRVSDPATRNRWALRIHREGYHSRNAIASELAWLIALRNDGVVITPNPIPGRNGELIQTVANPALPTPRHVVLFDWETGAEPTANDAATFEILGETTARMHAHARTWPRQLRFERHTWDFETSLGSKPHWGSWRNGVAMTAEKDRLFGRTVEVIRQRLERFGKAANRFGLIHGDMRLANILIDGPSVKVIDFDDSGFGWLLYDCASACSFLEHQPQLPNLVQAWVRGYRRLLDLPAEDEAEIPTFVMLRRLVLLAWIGSHPETDLAQAMGGQYTDDTSRLCKHYLDAQGAGAA